MPASKEERVEIGCRCLGLGDAFKRWWPDLVRTGLSESLISYQLETIVQLLAKAEGGKNE